MSRPGFALAMSAVVLLLGACASTQRALPSAAELDRHATSHEGDFRIGAGDVLTITVWRQPELSLREVVVRSDGRISVPLIDEIDVQGKTPMELKEEVTEKLSEYVTSPHVTVVVRQINSRLVFVIGEVKREGPIELRRDMRVVDALSSAGGFTAFDFELTTVLFEERAVDLLALEQALLELDELDPYLVRVVELRFFAGLRHSEVAELSGCSLRSAVRSWETARAWLYSRLVDSES